MSEDLKSVTVKMPVELFHKVAEDANGNRRSVSSSVVFRLEQYYAGQKAQVTSEVG